MSGIRVHIATTEGPVAVEGITREQAPLSVVCVKRSTSGGLPISGAYDAFVGRSTGVIEECFGPFPPGSFRLDVAAPIDDGFSWQLGAFLAHAALSEGRLAGSDEAAGTMVFVTGTVDKDLGVGWVEHVVAKLHAAKPFLSRWKNEGRRVVLLVPKANQSEAAAAMFESPLVSALASVSQIDDALKLLGLSQRRVTAAAVDATSDPQNKLSPRRDALSAAPEGPGSKRYIVMLAIIAAVVILAAGTTVLLWRGEPKALVPSPASAVPGSPTSPTQGATSPRRTLDDSDRFPVRRP